MPKGTRVAKCVDEVKKKSPGVNPYAVCQSSTHQSYASGRSTTKAGKPVGGKAPKRRKGK